jgi:transposase
MSRGSTNSAKSGKFSISSLMRASNFTVPLTYRATVDVPARFQNSKAVGAVFGLTPSKYQSGVRIGTTTLGFI